MAPDLLAFDHVHVFVANCALAEQWYARVFGFFRSQELEFWATGGGPLTIQNASGTVHLALFERPRTSNHATIALRSSAHEFGLWVRHLRRALAEEVTVEDHEVSLSLYFKDLDGNPFEITTYDYAAAKAQLP